MPACAVANGWQLFVHIFGSASVITRLKLSQ
jgi:hypothetical protein